jgi:hypothetical protein
MLPFFHIFGYRSSGLATSSTVYIYFGLSQQSDIRGFRTGESLPAFENPE